MNIHVYHHYDAKDSRILSHITKQLSDITSRLNTIERTLKIMSQKEKELGDLLAKIREEQRAANERGEKQIGELTQLVEDLKTKAEAEAVDLDDEIAAAEAILQTEKESFSTAVRDLPPDEAEASTETTSATDENAEETAEATA